MFPPAFDEVEHEDDGADNDGDRTVTLMGPPELGMEIKALSITTILIHRQIQIWHQQTCLSVRRN